MQADTARRKTITQGTTTTHDHDAGRDDCNTPTRARSRPRCIDNLGTVRAAAVSTGVALVDVAASDP
jgi:hypothetical protein